MTWPLQMLEQAYVVVFGFDIIGNPVALVRGVVTGTENLFYEPYEGALLGPEKFAEGLALGVFDFIGGILGEITITTTTTTRLTSVISVLKKKFKFDSIPINHLKNKISIHPINPSIFFPIHLIYQELSC